MELVKLLILLVAGLILAVLSLAACILHTKKNLSDLLRVLEDIEKGNDKRNALVKGGELTAEIGYKVNEIMAEYRSRMLKLEESEKAYKQLMTSLSHDVRTPLTSLIGYLDAIHNKIVLEEERDAYMEVARKKAYNLKDFVDLLFEWFKLESKERLFSYENMDINELSRNILTDWVPIFEQSGIQYEINIPESEYHILLDVKAYARILNNIIQNSMVHGEGDRIGICIVNRADHVSISIWDDGRGVAKEELPFIFNRLYMCDESRSHRGNGLGLAIARELVEAHGGTITASSVPKEKTIFTITLPARKTL